MILMEETRCQVPRGECCLNSVTLEILITETVI